MLYIGSVLNKTHGDKFGVLADVDHSRTIMWK